MSRVSEPNIWLEHNECKREMLDQAVKSKKPRAMETRVLTSGARPLESLSVMLMFKCHIAADTSPTVTRAKLKTAL